MYRRFSPLVLSFLIFSCTAGDDVKPSSIGRLSELVVVADSALWFSPAGELLRNSLTRAYPGLPQDESYFNLNSYRPGGFSGIVKLHRNIVHVTAGPDSTGENARLSVQRNVWASPQIVITATLPAGVTEGIEVVGKRLVETLAHEERNRLITANQKAGSAPLSDALQEKFGFRLFVPADYVTARNDQGFTWLRRETNNTSTGIMIYTTEPGNALTDAGALLRLRDSICKKFIPGPTEHSYMISDTAFPPTVYMTVIDGYRALVVHSLWRVEGDFMGGPFLSVAIDDTVRHRQITLEGFVYAPKFDKRNYMKQVEAILYSWHDGD